MARPSKGPSPKFQSTLPRRSDKLTFVLVQSLNLFQSTLPRRSDGAALVHFLFYLLISIHAPAKERRAGHRIPGIPVQISIHAPAKERPICRPRLCSKTDFNPRSREGATIPPIPPPLIKLISIHAPAKERRSRTALACRPFLISIHAPAKERLQVICASSQYGNFNPRSREGATIKVIIRRLWSRFQSTLPRRSDSKCSQIIFGTFIIIIIISTKHYYIFFSMMSTL